MTLLEHIGVSGAETYVKISTILLIIVVEFTFWALLEPSPLPQYVQLGPLAVCSAFFFFTATVEIIVVNQACDRAWKNYVAFMSGNPAAISIDSARRFRRLG
jgi:hypothetical protein